jgi:hypothetical protein
MPSVCFVRARTCMGNGYFSIEDAGRWFNCPACRSCAYGLFHPHAPRFGPKLLEGFKEARRRDRDPIRAHMAKRVVPVGLTWIWRV